MIELSSDDFHRAEDIFAPLLASQMFCAGVLTGKYEGQVFVDNQENPQTGFVVKEGTWGFLAGQPDNVAFNRALNEAIFARHIGGEKAWGMNLVCHPDTWDAQISDIFAPCTPIQTKRLHFYATEMAIDWRTQIPENFELRVIDDTLATDTMTLPGTVEAVVKMRENAPEPDLTAIGYVAVHNHEIVAYSVIDCIVGTGGDLGVFTDGRFRQRGLAFLTSAAVIDYGLSHGLKTVHWDCRASNTGSVRTAKKLGLMFAHQHHMYTLIHNPVIHEVNRGWQFFDEAQYQDAIAFCETSITEQGDDAHVHFYYIRALSLLKMGNMDAAANALMQTAQQGWDSLDEMQGDFAALINHEQWQAIIEQVTENTGSKI